MPYRNPEDRRACAKRYRDKPESKTLAAANLAAWRKANPEKVRATERRKTLRDCGWTPEAYDQAFAEQRGVCAICGAPPEVSPINPYGRLCGDHEHNTGARRGLLCHPCNRAIGLLKDSSANAENAMAYLRRYEKP